MMKDKSLLKILILIYIRSQMPKENLRKIVPFIQKLLKMLESPQCQRYIQWDSSSAGFRILHIQLFAEHVLPVYFKHKNYASFLRQLSFYNFTKVRTANENEHAYQHHYFSRDSS